ncbi:MAG: GNAT family N-acetyltransferase [Desulfarculaceae bacterium]|jgi:ribosomal protein S18 acetylase RimI-like enzyme
MKEILVRAMNPEDLDAMVEIDQKVMGWERPEFWSFKMELSQAQSAMASMVAEVEGRVVGFILGDASGWEYGIPNTKGYIDTIGVDPDYQRHGVATLLLREMVGHLKKVGVETIFTYVDWRNGDLLRFFDSVGFQLGDMINLQLEA